MYFIHSLKHFTRNIVIKEGKITILNDKSQIKYELVVIWEDRAVVLIHCKSKDKMTNWENIAICFIINIYLQFKINFYRAIF